MEVVPVVPIVPVVPVVDTTLVVDEELVDEEACDPVVEPVEIDPSRVIDDTLVASPPVDVVDSGRRCCCYYAARCSRDNNITTNRVGKIERDRPDAICRDVNSIHTYSGIQGALHVGGSPGISVRNSWLVRQSQWKCLLIASNGAISKQATRIYLHTLSREQSIHIHGKDC